MILNVQDGAVDEATPTSSTPPDGQNARSMFSIYFLFYDSTEPQIEICITNVFPVRMFRWTTATPDRDCAFEAGVIIHEYSHGRKYFWIRFHSQRSRKG